MGDNNKKSYKTSRYGAPKWPPPLHESLVLALMPFLAHSWDRGVPTAAVTVLPVLVNSTTTSALVCRIVIRDGQEGNEVSQVKRQDQHDLGE